MIIHLVKPRTAKIVMRARPLCDDTSELGSVRVCGADGVVAAGGEAPGADLRGVEVGLGADPVENRGPEAIGGGGVVALGGTVGHAGDVEDDGGPAAGEEFVAAFGIVWEGSCVSGVVSWMGKRAKRTWSMPIQPSHE